MIRRSNVCAGRRSLREDAEEQLWIGTLISRLFLLEQGADAVHDQRRIAQQQDSLHRREDAGQPLDERPQRRRRGLPARD